ncbi:MAG: agmatinase [Desulfovibrio sp.]|uniref:agmatinase n=1 Tax=Desulfovibrio sp. TaxID=885 RepID=UPI00258E1084|nr:agmatinase [Desulfovibrio sp.]MCD7984492.1 agmatinase [Desulfovibrio sp.]
MATVDSLQSPRFCGIRTFMRQPWQNDAGDADAVVLGVPFDSGVSYRPGARFGPTALREASTILKPYCPVLDVDINQWLNVTDCGDIDTIPGYMAESLDKIRDGLIPFFKSRAVPVVLGGDHSISLGVLRAVKAARGPVALVHFDAHSDTIPGYYGKPYNHGTPFYHALKEGLILPQHSIQIGIRGPLYSRDALAWPKEQGLRIVMGEELHRRGLEAVAAEALERTAHCPVFVSFDIDFLDASCAPGTGTPEVEGFNTYEGLTLLRTICRETRTVGMDLVEVLPDKDPSGITALAGASMVHAFLAALALKKSAGRSAA